MHWVWCSRILPYLVISDAAGVSCVLLAYHGPVRVHTIVEIPFDESTPEEEMRLYLIEFLDHCFIPRIQFVRLSDGHL